LNAQGKNCESPEVSIILPCRNEQKYIGKALDSLLANDYPKEKMEVFVVDGMSTDQTRAIVHSYSEKFPHIRLLDNPKMIVPSALNIAIQNAMGQIVIRMDAHNVYEETYVSMCVRYLREYDVDNVGGMWIILPGSDTLLSKGIALAIAHPFGAGNAYYKIGSKEPKYVDTVPFGCYKREVFDRIGCFDEELIRNQDDEFNLRLIKSGGKILLAPDIKSYYYARDSLSKLWRMYFQYGYFKPLVAKKVGSVLTWRQLVPALFVMSLFVSGGLSMINHNFVWILSSIVFLYCSANVSASFLIARASELKYLFVLPFIFGVIHFGYGLGYLKGILDFIVMKKNKWVKKTDIPITR
jgi:glycosyltransferase involved in cell wall biosynthesis